MKKSRPSGNRPQRQWEPAFRNNRRRAPTASNILISEKEVSIRAECMQILPAAVLSPAATLRAYLPLRAYQKDLRIRSMAPFSSRETCAWEMPISSAISIWVLPL